MGDEIARAAEFDRRLESLAHGDSAAREPGGIEDLALRVRHILAPPAPSAAFSASARLRLLHRLPRETANPRPGRRPALGMMRRLAFAVASVLVALSLGTAGVALAAQDAIPGDSLYGLKRGIEAARRSLTTDPQSQAALLSDLAAERMTEVEGLTDARREPLIPEALVDFEQTLDQLQAVADTLSGNARAHALAQAATRVRQHQQVLERLLGEVAPQALPAIEQAIECTSHSQEVLEALQQGQSPSDLAPGQDKTKEPGPKHTPSPPETKVK